MSEGAIEGGGGDGTVAGSTGTTDGSAVPAAVPGNAGGGLDTASSLGAVAPQTPPPGGVVPEWAADYKDNDLKTFAAKRDNWTGPEDVLRSYKDLEALRGVPESQLLKLVDVTQDREAWHGPGGIYEKLGRPETADQYNLPQLEDGPDVFNVTRVLKEAGHKHGISAAQLEGTWGEVFTAMQEFEVAHNTETANAMAGGIAMLKTEWGNEYEQKYEVAKRGAAALGFDVNSDQGLKVLGAMEKEIGTREFLLHMHDIGARLGEHGAGAHGSEQAGTGVMSPAAAEQEIERLNSDKEFRQAYLDGSKEHVDRMTQLFQFANPPQR